MGEKRWPEAADELRRCGLAHVNDGHLLRLRSERDPERASRRFDRDVPSAGTHESPPEHPAAKHVQGDDFTSRGIGDVRVAAVRVGGGVSRLAEAAQDVDDRERGSVDDAHHADIGVSDSRTPPHRLDAARRVERGDGRVDSSGREPDGDEPALEVGGDQRQRLRSRERRSAQDEWRSRSRGEELPPVHAATTSGGCD